MNRERPALLIVLGAICLGLVSWLAYQAVDQKRNTFKAGAPPKSLDEVFVPADIPLPQMRPPALRLSDPMRYGGASSSASVILFGNYRCPACRELDRTINSVLPKYRGALRYVWRLQPDPKDDQALEEAAFAYCAGLQGKFWPAHDAMLAAPKLDELTFVQIAQIAKLDRGLLDRCRFDPAVSNVLRRDAEIAASDGVTTTPILFVGTEAVDKPLTETELDAKIKLFMSQ